MRTALAVARTLWDLATLPTTPLLCPRCGAVKAVSPLRRLCRPTCPCDRTHRGAP